MKTNLLLAVLLLLLPAVPAAAQTTNFAARNGQTIVAFSATPTFDASKGNAFKITLTGNVTSSTLTGAEAGQVINLEICQDGTGGRTFVPPAQFQGFQTIASGANVCTDEIAHFDGTNAIVPTTATGGGGAGTVNSGTLNHLASYPGSGTTVGSNANTTEDGTSFTYAGSGGFIAPSFTSNGAGAWSLKGTEGACGSGLAGFDYFCAGDSLSHTAKISNNGGTFLTIPQYSNDSPTPFGPLYADSVFPRVISAPVGSTGQPFISGGASAPPGYGAVDVSSSSNVTGRIQKANIIATAVFNDQVNTAAAAFTLDMSASTGSGAFRLPGIAGCTTTTNGVICYNTTTNNFIGGMNSGNAILPTTTVSPVNSNCVKWVITSGNIQLGDFGSACGAGGGSPALSAITGGVTGNTIDSADNAQVWRWQLTGAGKIAFRMTETAASTSTGTPWLHQIDTVASSTLNPLKVTALGTTNGIAVLKSSFLTSLGTGGVDSNLLHCDVTDGTKCAKFVLSGITTATTRNVTVPDAASTIVVPDTGASNNFLTAISAAGAISKAQPSFSNLSGTATTGQLPAVSLRRICSMIIGADNAAAALANADIAPQLQQCQIPFAATVYEIDVRADAGTPNVIVAKRHCTASACTVGANETVTDLLSSALASGTAGAAACSNTGGTAGLDTFTTCSATLQNTSIAVGDYLETRTATAGGTAKRITVSVHYSVN